MRTFFRLLYHPFASTYDLVATIVSFGNWNAWTHSILPLIEGERVLELGHGPGHLQHILHNRGLFSVALDESAQMGIIAKRRIGSSHKLTRGLAQALPFQNQIFDAIFATFPTEYIFDTQTLTQVKRVLRNGGRLILLPVALPRNKLLVWLYKITGESPGDLTESIQTRLKAPFIKAGFITSLELVEVKSSALIIVVAKKP